MTTEEYEAAGWDVDSINDDLTELFERSIERKLMKNGRFEIHCKLGLWGVDAPTKELAEKEALHYWMQYHADGDYEFI